MYTAHYRFTVLDIKNALIFIHYTNYFFLVSADNNANDNYYKFIIHIYIKFIYVDNNEI